MLRRVQSRDVQARFLVIHQAVAKNKAGNFSNRVVYGNLKIKSVLTILTGLGIDGSKTLEWSLEK